MQGKQQTTAGKLNRTESHSWSSRPILPEIRDEPITKSAMGEIENYVISEFGALGIGLGKGVRPNRHPPLQAEINKQYLDAKNGVANAGDNFDEEGNDQEGSGDDDDTEDDGQDEEENKAETFTRLDASEKTHCEFLLQEAAKLWTKETATLKENNLQLLGIFSSKLAKCPAALEKVQSHSQYERIMEAGDGWLFIRLTIHVLAVRSTVHREISKTAAEKQFQAFEMSPNDSLVNFRNGFEHQLAMLASAGLRKFNHKDQARYFLDKLDKNRYVDFYRKVHQDEADGTRPFPNDAQDAYERAKSHIKVSTHSSSGGIGKAMVSMAISDDSDREKGDPRKMPKKPKKVSAPGERLCYNCGEAGSLRKCLQEGKEGI